MGERGERLLSPELQAERIRAYARARGLAVQMLPCELDVSGGEVERPILGQALERIEAGEAAGIIVAQLDRLSRAGIVATHHLIQRIEAAGGKLIAVAESFDDSTPEGRMGRNVMLALGEMQLERYRSGFAAAKRSAVERGIWPVSKVPRGYRRGPERRLVPGPDRELVRRAFEARAGGASWSQVAALLGSGPSGAAKTIRNRVYLGEVNLGGLRNPSAHEPIIDRDLWEAAQVPHPAPRRRGHPTALLAGIARCAACGCLMGADRSKRGWVGYRCYAIKRVRCPAPALISARLLDPFVEAVILDHARDLAYTLEPPADLASAQAGLEAAEAELSAYQRAQKVSQLGEDVFAAGMRSRHEAVEAARRRLAEARAVVSLPESGLAVEVWPTLSVGERNQVLCRTLSRVEVRRGRGDVLGRARIIDMHGAAVAVPQHLRERFREV